MLCFNIYLHPGAPPIREYLYNCYPFCLLCSLCMLSTSYFSTRPHALIQNETNVGITLFMARPATSSYSSPTSSRAHSLPSPPFLHPKSPQLKKKTKLPEVIKSKALKKQQSFLQTQDLSTIQQRYTVPGKAPDNERVFSGQKVRLYNINILEKARRAPQPNSLKIRALLHMTIQKSFFFF